MRTTTKTQKYPKDIYILTKKNRISQIVLNRKKAIIESDEYFLNHSSNNGFFINAKNHDSLIKKYSTSKGYFLQHKKRLNIRKEFNILDKENSLYMKKLFLKAKNSKRYKKLLLRIITKSTIKGYRLQKDILKNPIKYL